MKRISDAKRIKIVKEYHQGARVKDLCEKYSIAKSTFYTWVPPYTEYVTNYGRVTPKDLDIANKRIKKLESMIRVLQGSDVFKEMTVKEKEAAVDKYYATGRYSVHVLCDAFKLDRGTYYNHINRAKGKEAWYEKRKIALMPRIRDIFNRSYHTYGAKKITAVLRDEGERVNEKYISALMKEMGLESVIKYSKQYSREAEIATKQANRLQRRFSVDRPNRAWVTDMTSFVLKNRVVYLCAYLDLYSRKVVAFGCSYTPSTTLAKRVLQQAVASEHPEAGLVLHSDNGGAFISYTLKKFEKEHGIVPSYSRPGKPMDNAVAERFFKTLKQEFIYPKKFRSVTDFREQLAGYIEYYNTERRHLSNGNKTPLETERNYYVGYQVSEMLIKESEEAANDLKTRYVI